MAPLLDVRGLTARYPSQYGIVHAVTDVSFSLEPQRVLALLGESGSGKTTVALSILGLLPYPGEVTDGAVLFDGRDLSGLDDDEMRQIRGAAISMIFQNPVSGLNPLLTIGQQVEEVLTAHLELNKGEARRRALAVLRELNIPRPEHVAELYPFQISGGMAQRVMIGMATILRPRLLIADEPTSALDVTVQASILDELRELKERGTAILLITHDLGVVARMADDVAVMYGGHIVEYGDVDTIFARPRHPYTWALLSTRPRPDEERKRLSVIPGTQPEPIDQKDECPFIGRCPKALTICRTEPMPPLEEIEPGHWVACYNQIVEID